MKKLLAGLFLLLPIATFALPDHDPNVELIGAGVDGIILEKADTVERISMMTYIEHGQSNTLDLKTHPFFKNQDLSFTFSDAGDLLPAMTISQDGVFSWSPSAEQFNQLKTQSIEAPFTARLDDGSTIVTGKIRLVAQGEVAVADTTTVTPVTTTPVIIAVATEDTVEVEYDPLNMILPTTAKWNERKEGNTFKFKLGASGGSGNYTFELLEPENLMTNLNQYGDFEWTPGYDVATGNKNYQSVPLKIHIFDDAGNFKFDDIILVVENINRPPAVSELPTFYIQYDRKNRYDLKTSKLVTDPDGDSIIFRPVLEQLQQHMKISKNGVIEWKPSGSQFNYLRRNPIYLTFTVEDIPHREKTLGQLRLEISQEDLPPQVTIIPNNELVEIEENNELNLNFFITDPNGENDLLRFDFVSGAKEIGEDALTNKGEGHYEFSWIPQYDFVKEQGAVEEFTITFFAIDRENNRTEKILTVRIKDAENLLEKDRILYDQYRTVLERSWDLIEQLNDREKKLNKDYKSAKKGKKNRAIGTAGIGVLTGLSPIIFMDNPTGQNVVAGVGGTTTATIGTLEASNVLGESPSEIMKNLSYVSQKRNDLVIYGSIFASKYALPVNRRSNSFQGDLNTLSIQLNLKDIAQLELSASWENPKKATDRNIKKVFKDFNPDQRFKEYYP